MLTILSLSGFALLVGGTFIPPSINLPVVNIFKLYRTYRIEISIEERLDLFLQVVWWGPELSRIIVYYKYAINPSRGVA
jgi:hypothetical protein